MVGGDCDIWRRYLAATAGRGPRPLLARALDLSPAPGEALDLGCGPGGDVMALLERGFRVLAVDGEPEALAATRARAQAAGPAPLLTTRCLRFEDLELEPRSLDLVHAGFSLPFCPPERFDHLWSTLGQALRPGGLLAGQLFGVRDQWREAPFEGAGPMTFVDRGRAESLCGSFEVLSLEEEEDERITALGDLKRWHLFHLLLRRADP